MTAEEPLSARMCTGFSRGDQPGAWSVEWFAGGGGEFPPPTPAMRYFINVIPTGGPKLSRYPYGHYTGDPVNPRVIFRYVETGGSKDEGRRPRCPQRGTR